MSDPIPPFTTDTIALSMMNPLDPKRVLEANVYYVEGVNGNKPLSVGMLVMALCLARGVALEEQLVGLMNTLEKNSQELETLTEIENKLLDGSLTLDQLKNPDSIGNADKKAEVKNYVAVLKANKIDPSAFSDKDELILKIESAMDSKNSMSQSTMIDLQSLTNKRDQAYDMIANILKSLNNVLVGIANNM